MYALTVLDRIADAGAELAKARALAERPATSSWPA
jgi:hypothetical protein